MSKRKEYCAYIAKFYLHTFYKNKNDNIHKNEVQNIGFGIPNEFLSQRIFLFKSVQKQRNLTFVVQTVIWGKYNIGFGIPKSSQRIKMIQIGLYT